MLKLYVAEEGAERLRQVASAAKMVCTHLIAHAEMRSAFAKALRLGRISAAGMKQHRRELDHDWSSFSVLAADERLMRRAGDLIDRFPLRAFDAVHLAAAESLYLAQQRDWLRFASFDAPLNRAAEELGLRLLE